MPMPDIAAAAKKLGITEDELKAAFGTNMQPDIAAAAKKLGVPLLAGLSLRQSFADAAGQAKVVSQMGAASLLASHEMQQLMKEMTRG